MDEEKKPEGEAPPETAQPKLEPPASPIEGSAPAEAKPAEPRQSASPGAPKKPAEARPAGGQSAPLSADKPAAAAKPPAKPAAKPPPKKAATEMEVEPWEGPLVDSLKGRFGDEIKQFAAYRGQNFLVAETSSVIPILEFLKLFVGRIDSIDAGLIKQVDVGLVTL